jgi:hypothetical protein
MTRLDARGKEKNPGSGFSITYEVLANYNSDTIFIDLHFQRKTGCAENVNVPRRKEIAIRHGTLGHESRNKRKEKI